MDVYLISLIVSAFFWFLNKYYTFTPRRISPQTFHKKSTSRMGGLVLLITLLCWHYLNYENVDDLFILILISSLPIFFAGLLDDLFLNVKPYQRIILMIPSPILLFYLAGIEVRSVDIDLINIALENDIFALFFLVFAFVGIANAFNIIDGFNTLLLGYCFSICATLYIAGNLENELNIFLNLMFFSLLGIFTLNLFGKIFLGDAGAYLLGIITGSGLIIYQQTNDFSPWYVLLMFIYPVTEVLFSFFRKAFIRKKSAMQPDGLHFHMLIYKRISKKIGFRKVRLRHILVSLFILVLNIPFLVAANYFSNQTTILMILSLWYVLVYGLIYFILLPKYIFRNKN